MKAKTVFTPMLGWVKKNSPAILLIGGIAEFGVATLLMVKAVPEAEERLNRATEEKNKNLLESSELTPDDAFQDLTVWEEIKTVAPVYAPVLVTFAGATTMVILSHRTMCKRNAAAIAAYEIAETALHEWKSKTLETVDEKTAEKIRSAITKDQLDRNPVDPDNVIVTGNGDKLCMDSISRRYFYSSINKVEEARLRLNELLLREGEACLNDFYDYLGLDYIPIGYQLGWRYSQMKDFMTVNTRYDKMPNGDPVMIVDYEVTPGYDFRDY